MSDVKHLSYKEFVTLRGDVAEGLSPSNFGGRRDPDLLIRAERAMDAGVILLNEEPYSPVEGLPQEEVRGLRLSLAEILTRQLDPDGILVYTAEIENEDLLQAGRLLLTGRVDLKRLERGA